MYVYFKYIFQMYVFEIVHHHTTNTILYLVFKNSLKVFYTACVMWYKWYWSWGTAMWLYV